ncbi:hypothetical protein KFE98_07695 [bacterium SCSIO 12741]|nr:hypothetical protein KFE98_07695 [bacterium SCSIO 12741]
MRAPLFNITGLLLGITMLYSQGSVGQENQPFSDTISFHLTDHNNLSVQAVINQRDTVDLMFHTAAGDVTLISEVIGDLPSLVWQEPQAVHSWGGANEARVSVNNEMHIGRIQTDSLTIWETQRSGPKTDGKFGPDFFGGRIFEMNYDDEVLRVYSALPTQMEGYQKLPLVIENGLMFIEATARVGKKEYTHRFLIHSGYGGTLLFDDAFAQESQLGEQIVITDQQELKDSYGNVIKTQKGLLPSFKLGDLEFQNLPVGFFEGALGRQKVSVLGGDLLKRLNLIFDLENETIYIAASHWKGTPHSGS